MKLVLSRKGFDSGYGGMPSPILPDGRLVPLPIPTGHDRFTFADLNLPDVDVGGLLGDLSRDVFCLQTVIHLDPDLDRGSDTRLAGWRPALGQTGNSQSHLRDMGIGVEDVFLFFGWFRETEYKSGAWCYVKGAPHLHVMFGWIEVADVLPIVLERERCLSEFPWISNHPHVSRPDHYTDPRNTLYIAANQSHFNPNVGYGGGRFLKYDDRLRLTKPGRSRSVWSLPAWFTPKAGQAALSYHPRPDQWEQDGDRVTLRSTAKGQEFVMDCAAYPEGEEWLVGLIQQNA
ncbi:MAG: hypothetical protein ACR2M4_03240 [Actinomycetota bacterium]